MSIKVSLEHRTTYRFDRAVQIHPHEVRLRPAPHSRTPIEAYSLTVSPPNHFINWQQDPFGNWLARLVFPEPATELDITVGLVADMKVINPFDFFVADDAEFFPFSYEASLAADLEPYLRPVDEHPGEGPGSLVLDWIAKLPPIAEGTRTIDWLWSVNAAVNADVAYSVRMEAGVQTPDETLSRAVGSCRDSAWLLVSVLRQFGLAARFVSGYLVQLTADQKSLDGPDGPAEDFTDLHAWCEVFVPGAGWIGLDPTSALFAGEGHIPLAATPHPASAAPITGSTSVTKVDFSFSNTVTRIHEDPRVTLPYSPAQWEAIDAVGAAVDGLLADGDVRLTMGGEPTFVSLDDQTSSEWTTDADGEDKRRRASTLADRLGEAFSKGGLTQYGQGKWYPGEVLPRWQIELVWRTDEVPLWQDRTLLANPFLPEGAASDAQLGAAALTRELLAGLGLPASQGIEAFEDPLVKLAADIARPFGEAPSPDTAEPDEALVATLDADVTDPVAHVIPLHRSPDGLGWLSPAWRFRRQRLMLIPGDSPAGLRLPLDAVAWTPPEPTGEPSYFDAGTGPLEPVGAAASVVDPEGRPRTALVVQARAGFVHVFLPPVDELRDYLDIVARVERAAAAASTPVVLEGYSPPPDPRLQRLMVTPDPGVIEVNLQPTASWPEMRSVITTLYDEARQSRLSTETFDLDGSHTGTGGGNHITLGGPTPKDSPVLRRPDLLASLLTAWQRHPSLSYLFSGKFIGPTSQAPRVDEGRPEMLYELEIALAEIEDRTGSGGYFPPWTLDRALRDILTDVTGNTHRAEFCIDKLYNPHTSRGRLGLVELRGFEMPPHPQMALVQALLVRSLVAVFWRQPFTRPLIRWGTALHERFLLPHYCRADAAEVVALIRSGGVDFDLAWLEPFWEFRFPRIGTAQIDQVHLELRAAIEPWHVLGEESTAQGTARYVDSSVERLQVSVSGFLPDRHVVLCNNIPVPLAPTAVSGTYVAGVRYRAWSPPSALHPTLPVSGPLTFEVVDLNNGRSLGGARYHVSHPGGRSYDTPPVNAMEAESRRSRRFEQIGHTTGSIGVDAIRARQAWVASGTTEYPHTLDMRRRTPRSWGRPS